MPRNIELAERVLKQVTEHPETHEQSEWGRKTPCGTTACLAGWTILLAATPVWVDDEGDRSEFGQLTLASVHVDAGEHFVDDVARELLGMDEKTASSIFFAPNGLAVSRFEEWIEEGKLRAATSA